MTNALVRLVAPGPLDAVYAAKVAAAHAHGRGCGSDALIAEAELKNIPVDELCAQILTRAAQAPTLAERELQRQRLQHRIRSATSERELDAIDAEMRAAGLCP